MPRDNLGNSIPIGFNNKQDFLKARDGTRAATRANLSPVTIQQGLPVPNLSNSTECHIQIVDSYNDDYAGYPAQFVFRNWDKESMSDPDWIEGEACMAFDINDENLEVGRKYKAQVYTTRSFIVNDADTIVMYVATNECPTDPKGSSSSSSSEGLRLVDNVTCVNGTLRVFHGHLFGQVTVRGTTYPIQFTFEPELL